MTVLLLIELCHTIQSTICYWGSWPIDIFLGSLFPCPAFKKHIQQISTKCFENCSPQQRKKPTITQTKNQTFSIFKKEKHKLYAHVFHPVMYKTLQLNLLYPSPNTHVPHSPLWIKKIKINCDRPSRQPGKQKKIKFIYLNELKNLFKKKEKKTKIYFHHDYCSLDKFSSFSTRTEEEEKK